MEIPEPMIDGQVENMLQDTARRMQSQGLNLELYLKYTGMTLDQMKENMSPQAVKRIQTRLVLEASGKAGEHRSFRRASGRGDRQDGGPPTRWRLTS